MDSSIAIHSLQMRQHAGQDRLCRPKKPLHHLSDTLNNHQSTQTDHQSICPLLSADKSSVQFDTDVPSLRNVELENHLDVASPEAPISIPHYFHSEASAMAADDYPDTVFFVLPMPICEQGELWAFQHSKSSFSRWFPTPESLNQVLSPYSAYWRDLSDMQQQNHRDFQSICSSIAMPIVIRLG
jgi:hypothetical protein